MTAAQLISGAFGTGLSGADDGAHLDPCDATPGKPEKVMVDSARPVQPLRVLRRRHRRHALLDLVSALTRFLDHEQDISLMRGAFEEGLRGMVPVRAIQLREISSRWAGRVEAAGGIESIALEVPGRDPATRGVLEAVFDPGCRLGEWDFQMLTAATHLAALVLEIERSHAQLARAGLLNSRRPRPDAAALIGSTGVMTSLRSDVERVASTNFT